MISRYISVSASSQFILVFLVSCRLDLLFLGCLWHLYCCFLVFWRDPFLAGVLWLLFLLAMFFIFVSHNRNMIEIVQSINPLFCCWIGLSLLLCEDAREGCHLQNSHLVVVGSSPLTFLSCTCWFLTFNILVSSSLWLLCLMLQPSLSKLFCGSAAHIL